MRLLIVLSACLLVAACERPVLSRRPLVQSNSGAPALRKGIWLYGSDESCAIDTAAPAATWPDCADWTLVAEGRIVRAKLYGRHKPGRASRPYILSDGDPRVMQEPDTDSNGDYRYSAVKPLRSDAQGRIVEAETWSVVCPPKPAKGEPAITIPGLRIGEHACHADNAAVLGRVVAQGQDWSLHQTLRWIRDGDR